MRFPPPTPPSTVGFYDSKNISATLNSAKEVLSVNPAEENLESRSGKRKMREEEVTSLAFTEFMDNMTKWTATQNTQYMELLRSMNELKQQNTELQQSVSFAAEGYEDLKNQLRLMVEERKEHLKYINTLEHRVETLERHSRSSSIEITNIPKNTDKETKDDLTKIVMELGSVIETPINTSDIRDIYRINTKSDKSKPLIVEFNSVMMKDSIITGTKKYNKQQGDNKLNTQTLKLGGPRNPVFVAESLTFEAKRLFYLARDFSKTNNYTFCWSSHGNIYMRKSQGTKLIRIDSEEDIKALGTK